MNDIYSSKLPVFKILLGSMLYSWENKERVSKSIALPTLILVAIWAGQVIFAEAIREISTWIVLPFYLVGFTIFAVTCHRLVLRELIFTGWLLVIYFTFFLVQTIPLTILLNLPSVKQVIDLGDVIYFGSLAASLPAMYVLARLCLVFPATAIDKVPSLKWSWRATRRNGWRIAVVVGLYPWLLNLSIWLFLRDEATFVERAILALLYYFVLAVGIFALSLTYKEILSKQTEVAITS